jgi:hypothetical protein
VLVFTDEFSQKNWTYFLQSKDQTFEKFKDFISMIESETRHKIQILRMDRGGEYMSNDFNEYCKLHGISRELTQALMPQQNGVSKHRNRTIMGQAKSMSNDCKLPHYL